MSCRKKKSSPLTANSAVTSRPAPSSTSTLHSERDWSGAVIACRPGGKASRSVPSGPVTPARRPSEWIRTPAKGLWQQGDTATTQTVGRGTYNVGTQLRGTRSQSSLPGPEPRRRQVGGHSTANHAPGPSGHRPLAGRLVVRRSPSEAAQHTSRPNAASPQPIVSSAAASSSSDKLTNATWQPTPMGTPPSQTPILSTLAPLLLTSVSGGFSGSPLSRVHCGGAMSSSSCSP
mmetsp:Transcript_57393/g.159729  ORF Transcript_57393/g.159729 Transcript_57393/m.159729 type:complete len:232 (+) Transcript_57393:432-1127(+)